MTATYPGVSRGHKSAAPRYKAVHTYPLTGNTTIPPGMSNRLADEQSPYLLQHKDNPVDWFPWGEEAFEKARSEDKPIFLSIGYSTCHWCHVMEHESFEDDQVAHLLNDNFVAIKVDREERPDIDSIYMRACQMLSGQGGWPLTILMTPDRRPFHATTYVPKHGRFGRLGLMELLPKIADAWREQREKVVESADSITSSLQQVNRQQQHDGDLSRETLDKAFHQLRQRYDPDEGGFGSGPKFPTPHHLLFLLRRWKRTRDEEPLHMVEKTLDAMRRGGMYDHVGYGFHRYSTDARWLLPHFEKMLYDQALLTLAYLEAYQATQKELYAQTAEEVITYVLRDMTGPEGGFYSAEDADSEGEEGKFYVWSTDEVRDMLGPERADRFFQIYNFEEEGNFVEEATQERPGTNIPHLTRPLIEWADSYDVSPDELARQLEEDRQALFERREQRVRPGRDDKILTDWNGLMIAALARAGRVLEEPSYTRAAERAASFVDEAMRRDDDGRLLHRYRSGEAGILANLDDYASLTWGLVELYEATFKETYLTQALSLTDEMIDHFWDSEGGGFFFTPDDGEELITRQKEFYDAAQPSGNAQALLNLVRLARLTGRTDYEEIAGELVQSAAGQVEEAPAGFTALLLGLDFELGPTYEIVVVGAPDADDTQSMIRALDRTYLPNAVRLFRPAGEENPAIAEVAPFVREQKAKDGHATAYVCQNFACRQPTEDLQQMLAQLTQ